MDARATPPAITRTFVSALYLLGATLAATFAVLLLYGSVLMLGSWMAAITTGLGLAFAAGTSMAAGRGRVSLGVQGDVLLVRRWLRPSLRIPLEPRSLTIRPATYYDKAIGPVLVADEARSRRLHGTIDTVLGGGGQHGLALSGQDEDFAALEQTRANARPRVVLVPVRDEAAWERLRDVARALGPAMRQEPGA